eukprot:COSAG04_NODE_691_length_11104_cov_6.949841_11_plen_272_part_00
MPNRRTSWSSNSRGEGTKVMVKSDRRRGVSTMAADGDGDITIRFDDDGRESGYIKTRNVSVADHSAVEAALGSGAFDGAALAEADFRAACREMPQGIVEAWHEQLGLPAAALDDAVEAAVLEAKFDAVWGWADAVADGTLARDELERLADAVYAVDTKNKLEKVCASLGLMLSEAEMMRKVLKEAGHEVRDLARMEEWQLEEMLDDYSLREKLEAERKAAVEKATEKVEVSEEHFRAECRWSVGGWFERLELPLLRPEARCLDALCTACGM